MKTALPIVYLIMSLLLACVLSSQAIATEHGFRFDHVLHLEQDLECDFCHDAESSSVGIDVLLPNKDTCSDCHDTDDDCGVCHFDEDDPTGYMPIESIADRFSHVAHLDQDMACSFCHVSDTAPVPVQDKSECRTCHVTASNFTDCGLCHSEASENVPETHGHFWETWHGVEAGNDSESCMNCHTQQDCQDCHHGDNVRPSVHSLNFGFEHALEARSAEADCATCHLDQTFCSSCHSANRILPTNHAHADWVLPTGDGGEHAIEALFDLEGCVACHDDGSASPVCANCHGGG